MKFMAMALMTVVSFSAFSQEKMKMFFQNEDITKVIAAYSKASGQKFIVSPDVRAKATILVQEPVSYEEAFGHLSSALAVQGLGISKQGDTMVVQQARNIQRNLIEVTKEVPALKPERMVTWIRPLQYASPEKINSEIRILTSKDGEMVASESTKTLIFTDWASNLNRVAEIIKNLDTPTAKK